MSALNRTFLLDDPARGATLDSNTMTAHGTPFAVQTQLPIWPESVRGLPNPIARSALFSVANLRKGARKNYKRREVAALKGVSITYTGEELRMDDEDVFLQILHLARMQELGTRVCFTANSMITELGWTRNGGSIKRLIDCLDRMKASALAVTVESNSGVRENFTGSLIRLFRWREETDSSPLRQWEILLEPEIIALFNPASYSHLNWKLRLKLPPLAKWMQAFYHTHADPLPYKVETFHRLTDSGVAELRKFRYSLKQALALLVKQGFLISAVIDPRTDTVIVVRKRQAIH